MTPNSKPARRPLGEIWKAGLIGAGVAAIINEGAGSSKQTKGPRASVETGVPPVPHNPRRARYLPPREMGSQAELLKNRCISAILWPDRGPMSSNNIGVIERKDYRHSLGCRSRTDIR